MAENPLQEPVNSRFDLAFEAAVEDVEAEDDERISDDKPNEISVEPEELPVITLDSFEEPWAQDSRYVLTSPRLVTKV